ncbi:MAG: hypothetical protein PHX51_03705 [Clostridia bacterium]|nr:hypothetical protein [Clostridia bacterium]
MRKELEEYFNTVVPTEEYTTRLKEDVTRQRKKVRKTMYLSLEYICSAIVCVLLFVVGKLSGITSIPSSTETGSIFISSETLAFVVVLLFAALVTMFTVLYIKRK